VGLIWGAWHLAYFSFAMSYTTESAATLVPRFLVATIAVSIVYGEIRLLTNLTRVFHNSSGGVPDGPGDTENASLAANLSVICGQNAVAEPIGSNF
jgi:hypothetical protein